MKTILTQAIDGYQVVTGFGSLCIEAVETKKKVAPLMEGTEEARAVKAKGNELRDASKAYGDVVRAAKEAAKNGNVSLQHQHIFTAGQHEEKIKGIQAELVDLIHTAGNKQSEVWMDNLVYHEPKAGEILLEDPEVEVKYIGLQKGEVLTVDGQIVKDYRGVKYVKDGKVQTVSSLGAEPDGPLAEDLTPEQFEELRMSSLTDNEKAKELEAVKDGLAAQAANMRSKLEIQGETDALKQAQDWYNAELTIAQDKYGA